MLTADCSVAGNTEGDHSWHYTVLPANGKRVYRPLGSEPPNRAAVFATLSVLPQCFARATQVFILPRFFGAAVRLRRAAACEGYS
jgi:hypothetical protein